MIVGNGDIASALREVDRDDTVFFASGVSNSAETRESEFQRETDLLLKFQDDDRRLVYFSSLCVFYADTLYARHKKHMERMVKHIPMHTIIRLGNITWGDNPYTIINFFRNKIRNKEIITIRDEYRYIIDKDEFVHWIKMIPQWNCEMNITGNRMKISDIVKKYGNA